MSNRLSPTPLTQLELKVAAELLAVAGRQFSNHGCNDYLLDNTDEAWVLYNAMEQWADPRSTPQRDVNSPGVYFPDWLLMEYLSARLQWAAEHPEGGETT